MAIRVAHVGTGNVGRLALIELIANPQFELTGVCVSSPEKVGKDAGLLAGLNTDTGIAAVSDLDAVIATRPDCMVVLRDGRHPAFRMRWRMSCASSLPASTLSGRHPGCCSTLGRLPDKYIAESGRRCPTRRYEHLHQRRRSGIRQRPDSVCPRQHVSAHRAGALYGDPRLRVVRRRRGHALHGLRPVAGRDADAAAAGRAQHRLGHGHPPARGGPGHRGRRDHRGLPA